MRLYCHAAAPQCPCNHRQYYGALASETPGLARVPDLPVEVLARVVAKLPACEAVQAQLVSQDFRRAAAAGDELNSGVVEKLLEVFSKVGESRAAELPAASAAKRWLTRNAAGVKHICSWTGAGAWACMSLVSCLPALEDANLCVLLLAKELRGLLEALAGCTRLRALALDLKSSFRSKKDTKATHFPDAPAFAKLRSLTKLALSFHEIDSLILDGVAGAFVSLTGLAELKLESQVDGTQGFKPAAMPAALGQLKSLRSLAFAGLCYCAFRAGCLDLPKLLSLEFRSCIFDDAEVLPGVSALESLARIEFLSGQGPRFMDPELVELPRLQRVVYETDEARHGGAYEKLARLPADMGLLSTTLRHLDCCGQGLAKFPVALTQLGALECLAAERNEFTELPAAITALSRLTELTLGRVMAKKDPLQVHGKRPLDVRALGDLSGFPALRTLSFACCEVTLCPSLAGAPRHARLSDLLFCLAHPAPLCVPAVLRLSQALRRQGRGRVMEFVHAPKSAWEEGFVADAVQSTQALPPFHSFVAILDVCAL